MSEQELGEVMRAFIDTATRQVFKVDHTKWRKTHCELKLNKSAEKRFGLQVPNNLVPRVVFELAENVLSGMYKNPSDLFDAIKLTLVSRKIKPETETFLADFLHKYSPEDLQEANKTRMEVSLK